MQAKQEPKWIGLSIVLNSCFYFSIFSFALNSLMAIVLATPVFLINVPTNFILLGVAIFVSVLISIILSYLKKKQLSTKMKIPYYASICFSILYMSYYLSALFVPIKSSTYVVLAILVTSIVFALLEVLLHLKNHLFKAFIYIFVFAVPYFLLMKISNLGKGNKIFIVFAVYLLIFAIIFAIYYTIDTIKHKYENEFKEYKKMFK